MRRRVLNLLTALSLLLCVGSVAVWAITYRRCHWIDYGRSDALSGEEVLNREILLDLHRGLAYAQYGTYRKPIDSLERSMFTFGGEWRYGRREAGARPSIVDKQHRFDLVYYSFGNAGYNAGVAFPLWLPPAVSALLSVCGISSAARRRRAARHGCCARCGYDLRATPDRCPECGAADVKGELT